MATIFEQMSYTQFMAAMNSGTISWGDLCLEMPQRKTKRVVEDRSLAFGWDLEIPQLNLRKDIWNNLPVIVEALGTGADGAERHAIRVHRKNWSEWRETRAVDYDDWLNWDVNTEFRIMKALESSSSWTVEESDDPNTFAVIRMNIKAREKLAEEPVAPAAKPAAAPAADGWTTVPARTAVAAAPAGPVLMRINDITGNFPACWNNETTPRSSARRGDIISISIHNTKLRDAGLNRAKVERDLLAALRASTAWRVLPAAAGSRELCRLHMA